MTISISRTNLLTAARLGPIKPGFGQILSKDGGNDGTSKPEKAVAAGSATDPEGADSTNIRNPTRNQKSVVDQRVTDTPTVRITVISYSDGSSETLEQIKATQGKSEEAPATPRFLSNTAKGLLIDQVA